MKYYLNIYLDESGASNEHYFVVGGFYILSKSPQRIEKVKNKIRANIRKIELSIGKYRNKAEPNDYQFIGKEVKKYKYRKSEIKWAKLSNENKRYLTSKLENNGQINMFMICDLKAWIKKANEKTPHLDYIYNYSVRIMVERIIRKMGMSTTDEVMISLNIDQRTDTPKVKDKSLVTILRKAKGLEGYLNTTFSLDNTMPVIKVRSKQYDSKAEELIRYADYTDGVVRGMIIYLDATEKRNEEILKTCYENIHQNILCRCERLIRTNSGPIWELERKCKELNKKNA